MSSSGTTDADSARAAIQVAQRLVAEQRVELTRQFNALLSQFISGLIRIVPERRTQLELALQVVTASLPQDPTFITNMSEFMAQTEPEEKQSNYERCAARDVSLLRAAAAVPDNPVPYKELMAHYEHLKPASRDNIWKFLGELSARAQLFQQLSKPVDMDRMQADIERTIAHVNAWSADFAARTGRTPDDGEVQEWVQQQMRGAQQ